MPKSPLASRLLFALVGVCSLGANTCAQNSAPRPFSRLVAPEFGAPRLLQIVDSRGAPLEGTPSEPSFETRGNGLFFTLENGGTKNIWRAFPDPQDTSRFPRWKALPVTRFRGARFASNPVAVRGDRFLIAISNASSRDPLVGRFDLRDGTFSPLAPEILRGASQSEPAVSPDGRLVAFSVRRRDEWQLWGIATAGGTPFLLAPNARRAAWETNDSLFFQSLASGSLGVYRRSLGGGQALLFWNSEAEIAALSAEFLVFSSYGANDRGGREKSPRLFALGADGSGLRALAESEGARRPAVSLDGRFLAFDAPVLRDETGARGLWILPLLGASHSAFGAQILANAQTEPKKQKEEPFAQLHEIAPRDNGLAVRATLRGPAPLRVTLEVGEGESPRAWREIPVVQNGVENGSVALWKPQGRAKVWTLRLGVNAANGAAQSRLRVEIPPLSSPKNQTQNPIFPVLPLPPRAIDANNPTPAPNPAAPTPIVVPAPTPVLTPPPILTPMPTQIPASAPSAFAANFNVSGTLARMAPNQKSLVTFWGHNLGSAAWQTGGTGPDRVRVVARWVDFSTGTRRKWNFFWLKNPVKAGERVRFDLNLQAPSRPGRYKLIYGLVRVPAGAEFSAPPYSAPQEAWPAEFGAIAFAVDVVESTTAQSPSE